METREELIELYDLYKNVLTDKQRKYFEYYYFEDMSLTEISENLGVSKSIIGKMLKITEEKLRKFEKALHLKEISDLILSSENKKLIDRFNEIVYK